MSWCASTRNRHLSSCIKCGCLLVLERIITTTALLSQKNWTLRLVHWWPSRIGKNSLIVIGSLTLAVSGHCTACQPMAATPHPASPMTRGIGERFHHRFIHVLPEADSVPADDEYLPPLKVQSEFAIQANAMVRPSAHTGPVQQINHSA